MFQALGAELQKNKTLEIKWWETIFPRLTQTGENISHHLISTKTMGIKHLPSDKRTKNPWISNLKLMLKALPEAGASKILKHRSTLSPFLPPSPSPLWTSEFTYLHLINIIIRALGRISACLRATIPIPIYDRKTRIPKNNTRIPPDTPGYPLGFPLGFPAWTPPGNPNATAWVGNNYDVSLAKF